MKKKTQCCRWCRFAPEWNYASNGRILPDYGGYCHWEWSKAKLALPVSMTSRPLFSLPEPGWVRPNDGQACPAFEWVENSE